MTQLRTMVTGAAGFVGSHLMAAMKHLDCEIMATSKGLAAGPATVAREELDIADANAVEAAIRHFKPTHIVHLAGIPTVAAVAAHPDVAWNVNVFGTLNIARAILAHTPDCVLVFAGSGEVYGAGASAKEPVNEHTALAPANEYAATKAAADLALGAMAFRGLNAIRFRPFNHVGPGQSEDFVVSAFAAQIARIEAGRQEPIIRVGNLEAARDFLDVRDVVRAYALAIEQSQQLAPGTVINLASGSPRRVGDILNFLLSQSDERIRVEVDPSRVRRSDIPNSTCTPALAKELLGWTPQIPLDETLLDILGHWRKQITS